MACAPLASGGLLLQPQVVQEIRDGDEETRRQMRVLHEEVIGRFALLDELHRAAVMRGRRLPVVAQPAADRGRQLAEHVQHLVQLADRVAVLRQVQPPEAVPSGKGRHDPDYIADVKKMPAELDPIHGARMNEIINDIYATPRAIVERVHQALTRRGLA